MRAVVGLGNPGREYVDTRHNAGFVLADAVAHHWKLEPFRRRGAAYRTEGIVRAEPVLVLKPITFMNRSGAAITPLFADPAFDPSRDLLVVVDDWAIPLGTFRMRPHGSAGGHNGLKSVQRAIGSDAYARLRIGVGPLPGDADDPADFVLSPFYEDEADTLNGVLPEMVAAVDCWLSDGIATAMNRFNRRGPPRD